MPRPKKSLDAASSEKIKENIFKENPEGLPPTSIIENNPIAIPVQPEIPVMLKGVFLNNRDPGVALHFHYQSKTHPIKHYTLFHGLEHLLPREVVLHLESCCEPQYAYRHNAVGIPESYIKSHKYIFGFKNLRAA